MLSEIVYYGFIGNETFEEPKPVLEQFVKKLPGLAEIGREGPGPFLRCPAFKSYYDNCFSITSPFDVEIELNSNEIKTFHYGQEFFDKYILVRSVKDRFISFKAPRIIFFSENKDLILSQSPPTLSPNYINNSVFFPGEYKIGSHFRRIDYAFALLKDARFKILEGDDLYYVTFNTTKKITFKRFFMSSQLYDIEGAFIPGRQYTFKTKPLCAYYKNFCNLGYRKKVLKLIKQNLF